MVISDQLSVYIYFHFYCHLLHGFLWWISSDILVLISETPYSVVYSLILPIPYQLRDDKPWLKVFYIKVNVTELYHTSFLFISPLFLGHFLLYQGFWTLFQYWFGFSIIIFRDSSDYYSLTMSYNALKFWYIFNETLIFFFVKYR